MRGQGPRPEWAPPGGAGSAPSAPAAPTQTAPPYQQAPPPYGTPATYGTPGYGTAGYGGYGAPPKKRHTVRNVLLSIAGAFVVLIGAGVVLALVFGGSVRELDAYMDGKGTTYAFPKDKASVRLPKEPKYDYVDQVVAGTTVQGQAGIVKTRTYEMAYAQYKLATGIPADRVHQTLLGTLTGAAGGGDIKIGTPKDVKVDGHPAISAHGTVQGDEADVTVIFANGNVYMLLSHRQDDSAELQREFEASFDAG